MNEECDKIRELLPFLDDGTIAQEKVNDVCSHLAGCSSCHTEYKEMKDVLSKVRGILVENELTPVPGYLGLVRKKIEKKKNAYTFYYRVITAAAVIVFTVSLTLYGFLGRKPIEPMSEKYTNGDTVSEYDEYIASQYMSSYDLNELVDTINDAEEPVIMNTLITYNYNSITPEDIIDIMTEEELSLVFASQER